MSNFRIAAAVIFIVAFSAVSCSFFGTTQKPDQTPQAAPVSDLPFDAREPEVFSADMLTTAGDIKSRRAFFRQGSRSRLDVYGEDVLAESSINGDRRILIDHGRMIYTELAGKDGGAEPDFVQEMTIRLLRKRRYSSFEDLGTEGTVRRYRVSLMGETAGKTILHYDESVKMIVRHEFFEEEGEASQPALSFEMKNITFEVPDSVFAVPEGYRMVTESEYYASGRTSGQNHLR